MTSANENSAYKSTQFKPNSTPVDQIWREPNDLEEEQINKQMLQIAQQLATLPHNPEFNRYIFEQAKTNSRHVVSIEDIVQRFGLTEKVWWHGNLSIAPNTIETRSEEPCNLVHEGEIYSPEIYVPNIEVAQVDSNPIFSPGLQSLCPECGSDDDVLAWIVGEQNDTSTININESTAMTIANPLFVVSLHFCGYVEGYDGRDEEQIISSDGDSGSIGAIDTRMVSVFDINRFQINPDFEGWADGDSEFYITASRIKSSGISETILKEGNHTTLTKKIADVEDDALGTLIVLNPLVQFSNIVEPFGTNPIFFNTYERDWYASPKTLGMGTANNSTVIYDGNRKFLNEWFAFNPGTEASPNPLPALNQTGLFNSGLLNVSFGTNGDRGGMRFVKTN